MVSEIVSWKTRGKCKDRIPVLAININQTRPQKVRTKSLQIVPKHIPIYQILEPKSSENPPKVDAGTQVPNDITKNTEKSCFSLTVYETFWSMVDKRTAQAFNTVTFSYPGVA